MEDNSLNIAHLSAARLASILLHMLTEFKNSADLPNEGFVPDPKRPALHAIDRHAKDGLPRE